MLLLDSRSRGTARSALEERPLRNHDSRLQTKRTATLFAALDTLDGQVIAMCDDRHCHQERLKFLRVIDDVTPVEKLSP
jgi:hypothetical protein